MAAHHQGVTVGIPQVNKWSRAVILAPPCPPHPRPYARQLPPTCLVTSPQHTYFYSLSSPLLLFLSFTWASNSLLSYHVFFLLSLNFFLSPPPPVIYHLSFLFLCLFFLLLLFLLLLFLLLFCPSGNKRTDPIYLPSFFSFTCNPSVFISVTCNIFSCHYVVFISFLPHLFTVSLSFFLFFSFSLSLSLSLIFLSLRLPFYRSFPPVGTFRFLLLALYIYSLVLGSLLLSCLFFRLSLYLSIYLFFSLYLSLSFSILCV